MILSGHMGFSPYHVVGMLTTPRGGWEKGDLEGNMLVVILGLGLGKGVMQIPRREELTGQNFEGETDPVPHTLGVLGRH